ncbi:hypothetical protein BABINDRAFT_161748 [Babjeviella inositovora NRRL Y-12698]|uniref:Aldehyde dehydrogenase domain-containing protein n=1 Tax=Babjeviella inositovora NRRL Y-12698 TaxID=984486 RepID=A0A1E3QQJ6_9ASCO|nr:uncharacterized protein BABINDRAFT_161748 [Babjeviella inositovora NRRL Y-12698]ODQ79342.1 hypothetical protein BABINDRAFT_161748 [Babjeviella inositovora NRRL Y-12698]
MSDLFVDITLPNGLQYKQPVGLYINGQWLKSDTQIVSINPYTEEPITSVYAASAADVDTAAQAAHVAFQSWKRVTGEDKARLLRRLATLTEENLELLASLEAIDAGKPKEYNAKADVEGVAAILNYYAGSADKISGRVIPISDTKFAYTRREPLGVVGQIVPWNYPISMSSWKFAPALAAGNCIIIKSAENTPLSLLLFATLVEQAGFPPGVFNIISGYGAIAGTAISTHPLIQKVAFTGSTKVGQTVQRDASANLKNVTLECGGKSPLIVFDDADFEQAVKWAAWGIMYNSGQNCTANARIYVQDTIYDAFLEKFRATVIEEFPLLDAFDDRAKLGPVISKVQYDKIKQYIASGKADGARVLLGDDTKVPEKGYWIPPTVFVDCAEHMKIVREEIFGPVVAVSKFSSEEEVLAKANDSTYGLAAMVFTKDIVKAHRFAAELEAGTVYVNSSNDEDIKAPFGGYKMSGIGRELGEEGLEIYTQVKSVHINLGNKL